MKAMISSANPEQWERLLEGVIAENIAQLRSGQYPPLYLSGVVYRPEKGTEDWLTLQQIHASGQADCEDLSAARVAELRFSGRDPLATVHIYHSAPATWHAVVRRGSGKIEDPTKIVKRLERLKIAGKGEPMLGYYGYGYGDPWAEENFDPGYYESEQDWYEPSYDWSEYFEGGASQGGYGGQGYYQPAYQHGQIPQDYGMQQEYQMRQQEMQMERERMQYEMQMQQYQMQLEAQRQAEEEQRAWEEEQQAIYEEEQAEQELLQRQQRAQQRKRQKRRQQRKKRLQKRKRTHKGSKRKGGKKWWQRRVRGLGVPEPGLQGCWEIRGRPLAEMLGADVHGKVALRVEEIPSGYAARIAFVASDQAIAVKGLGAEKSEAVAEAASIAKKLTEILATGATTGTSIAIIQAIATAMENPEIQEQLKKAGRRITRGWRKFRKMIQLSGYAGYGYHSVEDIPGLPYQWAELLPGISMPTDPKKVESVLKLIEVL